MDVITMLPWCPLMAEVLGVVTKRRYFTLLHTKSGVQFFDGNDSGYLNYPAALLEFKNNEKNKQILKSLDWEGDNLQKLAHVLLFDQVREMVVATTYNNALQLLTFNNKDNVITKGHHDVISSETQAVEILSNWLLNRCNESSCKITC